MTVVFIGRCLCDHVSFESTSERNFQANCHCDDCRRVSGGAYGSYVFVPAAALTITGETSRYRHQSDHGTEMTKRFCPNYGSPLFSLNSGAPKPVGVIRT